MSTLQVVIASILVVVGVTTVIIADAAIPGNGLLSKTRGEATASSAGATEPRMVVAALQAMGVRHVVLAVQAYSQENSLHLLKSLQENAISVELLVDSDESPCMRNISDDNGFQHELCEEDMEFLSHMEFSFLYRNAPLTRQEVVVMVHGESDWATNTASKLLYHHIFGPWDTLVIVPIGIKVEWSWLQPRIPIGTRVAVIEVNVLKELQLDDQGHKQLRTVAHWRVNHNQGNLSIRSTLRPPLQYVKGANLTAAVFAGWDDVSGDFKYNSYNALTGVYSQVMAYIMIGLKANLNILDVTPVIRRGENGSWEGPLGFMERWESDMTPAPYTILMERAAAMDFTNYIYISSGGTFMTRYPGRDNDLFLLFRIFTWQVWATIAGVMTAFTIVLWIIWEEPDNLNWNERLTQENARFALFSVLMGLTYQSTNNHPKHTAGRSLIGMYLMIVVVLDFTYSGYLTGYLSVPRFQKVPNTFEDVLTMGYTIFLQDGYIHYQYMKTSPSSVYQQLLREGEISSDSAIETPRRVVEQALNGKLAFFSYERNMYKKYAKNENGIRICTLRNMKESIRQSLVGFGIPRNSPLSELINKRIDWLRDTGLYSKLEEEGTDKLNGGKDSYSCHPPSSLINTAKPQAFNVQQMGGVFIMWSVGIMAASAAFLAELIYSEQVSTSVISVA